MQKELKEAAASLKEAADSLRGQKKRKRRKGRILFVGLVGAGLALALSEGLRKKVLDALFGAEEEFEYLGQHHAGVERLQLDDERELAGQRGLAAQAHRF